MQQRTAPRTFALVGAWAGTVVLVLAATQFAQRRNDPAAVPGVRIAAVLLLEADARITASPTVEAVQRAERAALVRQTWDDAAQQTRLNPAAAPSVAGQAPQPGEQVTFVVSAWQDVDASPHQAQAVLSGYYAYRGADGVLRDTAERTWRLRLSRLDPVGRTRGWRLVSIG